MVRFLIILFVVILPGCGAEPERLLESEPVADFEYRIITGCSTPAKVVFENRSLEAIRYFWNFGDGTISEEETPEKEYAESGTYTVTLTAYTGDKSDTIQKEIIYKHIGPGPPVSLAYTRADQTRLEVEFEVVTEAPSFILDFGDGQSLVSTEKRIIHTYTGFQTYHATAIAENEQGKSCAEATITMIN